MKKFDFRGKLTIVSLISLSIISLCSLTLADKLCLQTTVNKKNFKASHKSVVAAVCPKGYTELADTASFRGADGADVGYRCVRREAQGSGSGSLVVSTACLVNEYILESACYADGPGVVGKKRLFTAENSQLSDEIYHTVQCVSYDPGTFVSSGSPYTLVAQAQCCVGR